MSAWTTDGTTFDWIPREAIQRIEQSLELGQAASAKLVYLALCRIANKEGSAVFSKPINYIATLASLNRRTVERRLPDLKNLKLVSIEPRKVPGTKSNDSSTYTLTTLSRNLTTVRGPLTVAVKKEQKKGSQDLFCLPSIQKPRSPAERIGKENKLRILKAKLKGLEDDTSEIWQRESSPQLVRERDDIRQQVAIVESELTA